MTSSTRPLVGGDLIALQRSGTGSVALLSPSIKLITAPKSCLKLFPSKRSKTLLLLTFAAAAPPFFPPLGFSSLKISSISSFSFFKSPLPLLDDEVEKLSSASASSNKSSMSLQNVLYLKSLGVWMSFSSRVSVFLSFKCLCKMDRAV